MKPISFWRCNGVSKGMAAPAEALGGRTGWAAAGAAPMPPAASTAVVDRSRVRRLGRSPIASASVSVVIAGSSRQILVSVQIATQGDRAGSGPAVADPRSLNEYGIEFADDPGAVAPAKVIRLRPSTAARRVR